jgi:hypothetical protein
MARGRAPRACVPTATSLSSCRVAVSPIYRDLLSSPILLFTPPLPHACVAFYTSTRSGTDRRSKQQGYSTTQEGMSLAALPLNFTGPP